MSVERIINRSRRVCLCEGCLKLIPEGSRYRLKTLFPSDVDRLYGDVPIRIATHLSCPPF